MTLGKSKKYLVAIVAMVGVLGLLALVNMGKDDEAPAVADPEQALTASSYAFTAEDEQEIAARTALLQEKYGDKADNLARAAQRVQVYLRWLQPKSYNRDKVWVMVTKAFEAEEVPVADYELIAADVAVEMNPEISASPSEVK